jgi:DNA integrity scanning protein DisA with diadenylate cyclase activity
MAMDGHVESSLEAIRRFGPTIVYIITDSEDTYNALKDELAGKAVTVLTGNRDLEKRLKDEPVTVKRETNLPRDILLLSALRHYLLRDCLTRTKNKKDRVLCVMDSCIKGIFTFEVEDIEFVKMMEQLEDSIDLELLEHIIDIALEIASEGKEGRHVGALFILGDTKNVLENTRDQIINPFEGHPPAARDLHNRTSWETVKQFAQLDGAVVIDDNGIAVAAGRYVNFEWSIYLESGFGGRHTAAATISKKTKAVSVVISETGNVRIYKNGKNIFSLKGR